MPKELLIKRGHVVTVDPDLLAAAGDHAEQASKLMHVTRHHLGG